jgi:hypothetical protein
MRLKCRFPDMALVTYCGIASIEMRRQRKVLLQFQFETSVHKCSCPMTAFVIQ